MYASQASRWASSELKARSRLCSLAGIDGAARELADRAVHGYRDSITHRGPIIVGTGTAGGNSVHLDRTAANDQNSRSATTVLREPAPGSRSRPGCEPAAARRCGAA